MIKNYRTTFGTYTITMNMQNYSEGNGYTVFNDRNGSFSEVADSKMTGAINFMANFGVRSLLVDGVEINFVG